MRICITALPPWQRAVVSVDAPVVVLDAAAIGISATHDWREVEDDSGARILLCASCCCSPDMAIAARHCSSRSTDKSRNWSRDKRLARAAAAVEETADDEQD